MGDDAWNVAIGWRWMFFAGVVPAVLFGAMIVPAVESPRWLMKMSRRDQALDILCRLNGPEIAAVEADQIQAIARSKRKAGCPELFTTGFRRALLIGIMLGGAVAGQRHLRAPLFPARSVQGRRRRRRATLSSRPSWSA